MSSIPSSSPVKPTHKSNASLFPVPEARIRAPLVQEIMEEEMRTHWVGPMPVDDFFKEFMDGSNQVRFPYKFRKDFFKTLSEGPANETDMYPVFLKLMERKVAKNFLPGFKLVNTSSSPDPKGDQKWRIDFTCYSDEVDTSERGVNQLDKAEWGIEFKYDDSDDPFGTSDKFVDEKDEHQRATRGQITAYAAEWFNHQYRTHIFMVFISKNFARFLRFDRSGAVVTERFEYAKDSKPLVNFMWYFVHLSAEQRGIDTTVRKADPQAAETFRAELLQFHLRVAMLEVKPDALKTLKATKIPKDGSGEMIDAELTDANWNKIWDEAEHAVRALLDDAEKENAKKLADERMPDQRRDVVYVKVYDSEGEEYGEVITQGFSSSAESVVGRSTRAWPAWDLKKEKLCYLKDSWRPDIEVVASETEILEELKKFEINRIPLLVSGGDVPGQKVRTGDFTGTPRDETNRKHWVSGTVAITPRLHHRLLMDFIGRSIKYFSHTKQMIQAVYDAFNAHKDAWETCRILHRDISVNNVMLDRWGRGVLNDWDMAKKQPQDVIENARRHARTGTWYFMSTLLLKKPGKPHTVQDDLESFVLLVFFLALSYTHHSFEKTLAGFMTGFFQETKERHGAVVGGHEKFAFFGDTDSELPTFTVTNSGPLDFWLKGALLAVQEWVIKRQLVSPETLTLYDHRHLSTLFKDALKQTTWPKADKYHQPFSLRSMYKTKSSNGVGSIKRSFDEALDDPVLAYKRQKIASTSSQLEFWPEGEEEAD